MNVRLKDGTTEYDNLESAARQGDLIAQQKLSSLPTIHEAVNYIWQYYQELAATRSYAFGSAKLTYTEILAWSQLRRILLDGWELDTLLRIDAIFIDVEAKADEKRRASNG